MTALAEDPALLQKKIGSGQITESSLKEYLELDKEIQKQSALALVYRTKERELKELQENLRECENRLLTLQQNVEKEHADFVEVSNPSVQDVMRRQGMDLAKVVSKEEHEYLEALSKKEMCEKELAGFRSRIDELTRSMEEYKMAAAAVNSAYDRQDAILADAFNGEYGSEKEQQLEGLLDDLQVKRYRVHLADYNWRYARKFLYHAVLQMAIGLRRWIDITRIPYSAQLHDLRVQVVSEASSNFLAASQNFRAAQSILPHIDFPYCKPSEIDTLEIAVSHIFTDMQTNHRYQHAFSCYNAIHLRSAALLQWFDRVITENIALDKANVNSETHQKSKELKIERINLMVGKMKEILNVDVDANELIHSVEQFEDDSDDPLEMQTGGAAGGGGGGQVYLAQGQQGGSELDKKVEEASNSNIQHDPMSDLAAKEGGIPVLEASVAQGALAAISRPDAEPPKRSLSEIAEKPSDELIFGNTDKLFHDFGASMQSQQQVQDSGKAHMQMGLQKKLAERKARAQRMQAKTG